MSRCEAEVTLAAILQPINVDAGQPVRPIYTFQQFVNAVYLPMHEISREELQHLLDSKSRSLARSVVDHLRFRLRSIFELGVTEGVMDRNSAVSLYTPKQCKSDRERLILTPQETIQMTEGLDLRERLIVRLATWEGMRPGEILGLQVGDVGTDSISVRRRLYKGNIDSPKTKRSIRQVALTNSTAALISQWIRLINTEPGAWLFPSETLATPMTRDNLWRRNLLPKLKTIGLEWATFQVMRRTFATLSKQVGVDPHTRSAQMGNTVDVSENEYAVSQFEDRLAAVRKMEHAMAK